LTDTIATQTNKRTFKMPNLGIQILIALVLGIIAGIILHNHSSKIWIIDNIFYPAGQILILMIKMIVVPIVVSTLTVGIAGDKILETSGKWGLKQSSILRSLPLLPLL